MNDNVDAEDSNGTANRKKRNNPSENGSDPTTASTTTTTTTTTATTRLVSEKDNPKRSKTSGRGKAASPSTALSLDAVKHDSVSALPSSSSSSAALSPPLSLHDIQVHLSQLPPKVPPATIPQGKTAEESVVLVKQWALEMQTVMEELSFWLACLSTATYKWGSDRTGAAEQNLALLTNEVATSQDQLSNSLHQRLANVLAPVVDLVTTQTKITTTTTTTATGGEEETGKSSNGSATDKGNSSSSSSSNNNNSKPSNTKTTTQEVRENEFAREIVDVNYFRLSCDVLRRNSSFMRQVLLCHLQKINSVLDDYQKALTQETDSRSQNNAFAY